MIYQVTDNYTIRQQSNQRDWPGQFREYFMWKSKIYLSTSKIVVPVHLRLILFLKHPQGIHVHDGPGMDSDQVNHNSVMVCKGRGYNFYFLVPYGGRLFNSHMTYDITSCICDVTSCM